MRKLGKTNHPLPEGYELFVNATDGLGRRWNYCVSHVRGGSILYIETLSDLVRWIHQVEDIRAMQDGKQSFVERVMDRVNTGDIPWGIAEGMIKSHNCVFN